MKCRIAPAVLAFTTLVTGCAAGASQTKPDRIVEVEAESDLSATIIASMKCMGEKETSVHLIGHSGRKWTFACREIER